jgi:hypothetical protein
MSPRIAIPGAALRLTIVGLALALASLFGWSVSAKATSYDPTFNNPQMIVVRVHIVPDSEKLGNRIDPVELRTALVKYLAAQLEKENIGIPVVEEGYQEVPDGILQHNITEVTVRIDMGFLKIDDATSVIMGSVTIYAIRDNHTFIPNVPAKFFTAVSETEIADRAAKAAYAQVQTSVVEPIVFLAK